MQIYHNPRCRKSRETLEIIKASNGQVDIIEYLKTPPSESQLIKILGKLGKDAEDITRKGESLYKEKYKGKELTKEEWVKVLVKNPILIERPIVVNGDRAVLGRPPENVKSIL